IGIRSSARSAIVLSNDEVLVAGISANPVEQPTIVKYTAAGAIDTSFGSQGITILTINAAYAHANSIGIQSTGNIIIAGNANISSTNNLLAARFTSAGILDTTFGPNGTGMLTSVLAQDSGYSGLNINANDQIFISGFLVKNNIVSSVVS